MKAYAPFTMGSVLTLALTGLLAMAPADARAACGDGRLQPSEECDDGNVETGDCCSASCTYEAIGSPCAPSNACYAAGTCDHGGCNDAVPVFCTDGNPCTTDSCDPDVGCVASAIDGCCTVDAECDNSILCDGLETCVITPFAGTGSCSDGPPMECDDGDPCTRDACGFSPRGCQYTPGEDLPGCVADDVDADGVWDRFDLCLDTPVGSEPVHEGCSSGDLAEKPLLLIDDIDRAFETLMVTFLAPEELARERRLAGSIRLTLERGAYAMAAAKSCAAEKQFFKAEKLNEKLLRSLDKRRRAAFGRAGKSSTPGSANALGDQRAEEIEASYFELATGRVQDAAASLLESSFAASTTCRGSIPANRSGTIAELRLASGRVLLEDGTLVRLGGAIIHGTLLPGLGIAVLGEMVDPNDVVAGQVVITPWPKLELAPFDITQCWEVRVAPVQPEEDLATNPLVNEFKGFHAQDDLTGNAWLERGMAMFVVEKACAPPGISPDGTGKYTRYFVDFAAKTKSFLSSTTTYANGQFVDINEYWKLPDTLNGKGELKVSWYAMDCNVNNNIDPCSGGYESVRLIREELHKISVTKPGGYCQAQYDKTEFALPDRDPDFDDPDSITFGQLFKRFEPASVVSMTGLNTAFGGTRTFGAEAYKVTGADTSSFPNLQAVALNQPFAIYPTRDPFLTNKDYQGVDHAAGIAWPTVSGVRNGGAYRYVCSVPPIVRDVVDFCADEPNSYYQLPYAYDLGEVRCGQGNNSTFTHCGENYPHECGGKYAFDMSIPSGKPILAARGGVVIGVRDNAKNSCSDKTVCTEEDFFCCVESSGGGICTDGDNAKLGDVCHSDAECDSASPGDDGACRCAANGVNIQHADGSVGQYAHMLEDGVEVELGERVLRGDRIGRAGNTGCSTGTHLHFHVIGTAGPGTVWQKATQEVRFQYSGGSTCAVPVTNGRYRSNNDGWLSAD